MTQEERLQQLFDRLKERVVERYEAAPPEVQQAVDYVVDQVEKVYEATPFLQWIFEVALPKLLGS